jgi:putative hydrolase of the HAD superfamily
LPSYRGHAFVDWDDTLAENMRYFREAEEANAARIAAVLGVGVSGVQERGQINDVKVANTVGLGRDSFHTAWLMTYHELCAATGAEADPSVEVELIRTCATAYDYPVRLLSGAEELLRWLRADGYEVTIWTAGSPEVQHRKIDESGIGHLAHRRRVVLKKTPGALFEAMEQRPADSCFVLGNSLHSDVAPALAVGVLAIHLDGESWGLDNVKVDTGHPLYRRVAELAAVPPLLTSDLNRRRAY